jgi:hypothetical protein
MHDGVPLFTLLPRVCIIGGNSSIAPGRRVRGELYRTRLCQVFEIPRMPEARSFREDLLSKLFGNSYVRTNRLTISRVIPA